MYNPLIERTVKMILEKELFEFTAKELVKIYAKNFYYIQRSMKARERKAEQLKNKGGWKYIENTSYNLFKEMLSPDKMLDMSRNDILHLVKISQTVMQDKHHTLSGTEEQIKKQYEQFAKRNYETVKSLLEKEGGRGKITDKMIKTRMKDISNDKDYYDFLHSDEYKKLTEKYKIGSDDLQRDYILNQDNALNHYGDFLKKVENNEMEFTERELFIDNPFED